MQAIAPTMTIAAMERLGADRGRIVAALGPMIRQRNYEVGSDLRDRFAAADPANGRFSPAGGARASFHVRSRRRRDGAPSPPPASAPSRMSMPAPMRMPTSSSAIAGLPTAATPIMAGTSMPSCSPRHLPARANSVQKAQREQ